MLRRIMPNALPADANARLPKARMIDPRGHRFGAGVSAIALILAFLTGTVWLVGLARTHRPVRALPPRRLATPPPWTRSPVVRSVSWVILRLVFRWFHYTI